MPIQPQAPEAELFSWPAQPDFPGPPEPDRLPRDVLPPALAAHVRSVTDALQVPHELPLMMALACVSTAVAGAVEVEIRPGWKEPINIYTAIILPPASRKSPAYKVMTDPIREWETENIRRAESQYLDAKDLVDVEFSKLEAKKKAMAKGKANQSEVAAARTRVSDAEARVPPDGRLLVGDATPEALVQRLAAQGARAAILEPEPGPFQMAAGKYSPSACLGEINRAWSGEDIIVDRVGRPPLKVRHPTLTMAVLLQPGVLENLPNQTSLKGEGFIARFLIVQPPHGLGSRCTGTDVPLPDEAAAEEYSSLLGRLLSQMPAGREPNGRVRAHIIHLNQGALDVLHAFEAEVERGLGDRGKYAAIRDWAGKMVGQAIRVAALLELAARAGDDRLLVEDLGEWAMAGGVRLVRALATHALAVLFELSPDPHAADLRYVLRRLQDLPEGASENDLREATRGRRSIKDSRNLRVIVDELEARGCLRRVPQPPNTGPGRTRSKSLQLHPTLRNTTDAGNPENGF